MSTEINAVLQDGDGYIWTGSADGLQRFDGTRFRSFRHVESDPASIPSNVIVQLIMDGQQNLWLQTSDGKLGIFNTRNFRFTEMAIKASNPEILPVTAKRLIRDEQGDMYVFLGGHEVLSFNEAKKEFSTEKNFFKVPPGTGVADFRQQPGTSLYWISIREGVAVYNRANGKLSYPGHNTEQIPAVDALASIQGCYNLFFDKKGRLWFQHWGPGYPEVYCYNGSDNRQPLRKYEFISTLKTYHETYPFFEQQDGTLWITGLSLFARFQEAEKQFQLVYNGYRNERSISYERVTALTEDREKNIWVCTSNNGLYRFNPSQQYFMNITHRNRVNETAGHGSIMSFIPTKWGTILACSWGDGIFNYDRNWNELPAQIRGIDNKLGPSVWCMIASGDSNTIWMAAQPGLYALDQATRTVKFYNPAILNNKTLRQVAEDPQGNLWLGMNNFGVFTWNAADKRKRNEAGIKRFDKIPAVMINKVIVDRKGLVWVGTAAYGLYVVDPVSGQIVQHFHTGGEQEKKLPEAGISSILDYDDSTIIITTSRHLIAYNRYEKKSRLIGKPDFMQGSIASMEKDRKGYLWLSTTSGIYRVNLQNRVFVLFDRADGIDNDRFTLSASRVLPDGKIVLGSTDQFVVFDPAQININSSDPVPRITDFKVMNKSLLVDSLLGLDQVQLLHNSNSLEIQFSPMAFNTGSRVLYRMEGLEKEWKLADKNNQAVYSYLPAGKYNFQLRTVNSEGQFSEISTSLKIKVTPPFWKSWWFFSFLAVVAGGFLFWLDRERIKRKEAIEKMRSTIADNLHGEVNSALNNINILSEMARLKADKDPEKSKEYLEQIHSKSHNMIIAMDDMLWSLDPANDSMKKTNERMREYVEALRNRHGVNMDIAVDKKVETLELNMKLRHDAFLVFKEGIKNLVTVGADNCHIYIRSEKGVLLFTTLFDSTHCDMQQLNNLLHRQDLERRLDMMGAEIEIDLHRNHSAITLRVPVK